MTDILGYALLLVLLAMLFFLALRPRRLIYDPDHDITDRWWVRAAFLASALNLLYSMLVKWSLES
jgi:hypothetical protein